MIRVLVIDDSAYSRRAIKSMLESAGGVEVVGVAMDGEQGLRAVAQLNPDVITLDLEMPGLNGFAFLRILMRRRPTPVIVVSSYAGREDVLRALELGALDFVAKPTKAVSPALMEIREELVSKVVEAGSVRMDLYLQDRPTDVTGFFTLVDAAGVQAEPTPSGSAPSVPTTSAPSGPVSSPGTDPMDSPAIRERTMTGAYRLLTESDLADRDRPAAVRSAAPAGKGRFYTSPGTGSVSALEEEASAVATPEGVVVVGASTGGPRAIRRILGAFQRPLAWPMVIVQHMPARFTTEFARRLARKLKRDVREATDGQRLVPGRVLVAPGGLNTEIGISASDHLPFVRLRLPEAGERYVPSVDRLFISASDVFGGNVVGVVLTGMGNDGVQGVCAVRWAGGRIIAEDQSTAVVFGMPQKAIATGLVESVCRLEYIPGEIVRLIDLKG